ncbi:thioredoxin-like protein [Neurospora crassa]|nr:thioredoxin-like protein [Neurospora crassa]
MALPPKFAGHRFIPTKGAGASSFPTQPLHTVEIFLDYVCPFSAKIYNTLYTTLLPSLRSEHTDLGSKVQFIFRHQIQPWHPSSTLTHEAGLAVQRLAPAKFWDFSAALFKDQKAYFDVSLVNETRNETYKRLAKLASQSAGVDEKELYELLAIPTEKGDDGSLNVGNAVTNDLKTVIKMARLVGVHVSPTVIFDGVVAGEVSSSWTLEQWLEYLRKSVA